MINRFRVRAKAAPLGRFLLIGMVFLLTFVCFELYRLLVPFMSANPLWTQVTIGQPVIHGWMYGGVDEEGYLKFYNQSSPPVLIPPDAHLFDADGEFVILEGHTPSSLTFAQPYQAIPMKWMAVGLAVTSLPIVVFSLRLRQRRRGSIKMKTRVRRGVLKNARVPFRSPTRSKSFRSNRRPWS